MKNQRKKTEARSVRFSAVMAVLFMLAALICCFTVVASADVQRLEVELRDLAPGASLQVNETGDGFVKTYDGTATADLRVHSDSVGIDAEDLPYIEVVVKSAAFDSKDVKDATKITVLFDVQLTAEGTAQSRNDLLSKYAAPREQVFGARITPATLDWAADASANVTFVPGTTTYNADVTAPALTGMVNGETAPAVTSVPKATVNGVTAKGTYTTQVQAVIDSTNYVAAPLDVEITVDPIVITSVQWDLPKTSFVWGDADLAKIAVVGFDAQDNPHALGIVYADGFGNAGTYTLTATVPNDNYSFGPSVSTTTSVTVNKKIYTVKFNDQTFLGDVDLQKDPTAFMIAVEGDLPADIRARITYTVNGAAFNGASAYGVYTVTATLPTDNNYEFEGATNGVMTAKMTVLKQYVAAGNADAPYQMILLGENGFSGDITASVLAPEINRRALRGFRQHTAFTLQVNGAAGETFTVLIPISDTLYGKRLSALTADDLYIYEDANHSMASAKSLGYTVTVKDGYYQIEGVSGNAETTFVLAPEYNPPFFATPLGIALLVLLVLALIALLYVIGIYLRSIRDREENKVLVMDTEGDLPEIVPAEIEEKVDLDETLDDNADRIAAELDSEIAAEAAEDDVDGVDEAVADAKDELMAEVEAIELEKVAEEVAEDVDATEAMANEMAENLQNTVVAAEDPEAEVDEARIRAAVAEALAENFNESADATDAIVIVPDEEDDAFTIEDFKAVVDAIVSVAMCRTMELPEIEEEVVEEVAEKVAEEAVEEVVEEAAEEVAEEAVEEAAEEVAEEAAEEVAEEAVEEVAEEAAEEAAEEVAEEAAEEFVVEEMSNDDVCAVVANSVAEAFELITADGVAPKAVEGTTVETIAEAVNVAAEENVPESWTAEMADAVKEAVVEELAARLLAVEEPAVETFAAVNEEDDDEEDDEEDYGGFGSMPLDFIDAIEEADKYAEMLEEERKGYVRIVTRYKRSFQSRVSQSQGNVQEYYNIIKNALLSYKGVKNRISWNYEAFNRGRIHVAKINAKTKTLYLYLALDPAELVDTKYGIVDMSSKKKYASVPVLMKIKGERKFKYALELIDKLCGEGLELPKLEKEEVDYRIPYQTTEEMVQAGLVKKLVASVPVVYSEADTAEPAEAEVVAPSAAAEAQEITFVEPTDAPAVEAAAEEIPADAEVSAEETTEI